MVGVAAPVGSGTGSGGARSRLRAALSGHRHTRRLGGAGYASSDEVRSSGAVIRLLAGGCSRARRECSSLSGQLVFAAATSAAW